MGEEAIPLGRNEFTDKPANDDGLTVVALGATRAAPRLSETLYGIRWEEHLPLTLEGSGVTVSVASWQEIAPFIQENHVAVFGDNSRFYQSTNSDGRERYMDHAADLFLFRDKGRIVGTHICNPVDWATYYVRNSMLLPEYQGRQVVFAFTCWMFGVLGNSGVERVEIDTAPSNWAGMSAIVKAGFVASGTLLSDRWGAQCRFVRYLEDAAENVHLRQFCSSGERHVEARRKPRDSRQSNKVAAGKEGL